MEYACFLMPPCVLSPERKKDRALLQTRLVGIEGCVSVMGFVGASESAKFKERKKEKKTKITIRKIIRKSQFKRPEQLYEPQLHEILF